MSSGERAMFTFPSLSTFGKGLFINYPFAQCLNYGLTGVLKTQFSTSVTYTLILVIKYYSSKLLSEENLDLVSLHFCVVQFNHGFSLTSISSSELSLSIYESNELSKF